MFFDTSFNYFYFKNRAANSIEICNIYVNQLVIKVVAGIINSDKFKSQL